MDKVREDAAAAAASALQQQEAVDEADASSAAAVAALGSAVSLTCRVVKSVTDGNDKLAAADEGCETPKSEEHRIPDMPVCPPAPRKPRPRARFRMAAPSGSSSSLLGKRKNSEPTEKDYSQNFFFPSVHQLEALFGPDPKLGNSQPKRRKHK